MRLPSSTDIDHQDDMAVVVREWATITLCALGSLAILYFTAIGIAASMIAWGWTA